MKTHTLLVVAGSDEEAQTYIDAMKTSANRGYYDAYVVVRGVQDLAGRKRSECEVKEVGQFWKHVLHGHPALDLLRGTPAARAAYRVPGA